MEDEEIAGHLRRAGHFRRTWNTQDEQIEDEAKVLSHEGSELQTADDSVRVGVVHVLVVDDHVVLGRHVIGDVVIDDETQKTIEQCEIDLFVQLLETRLEHHVTFTIRSLPHVLWKKIKTLKQGKLCLKDNNRTCNLVMPWHHL